MTRNDSLDLIRLDVGCGNRKESGWVGMDARPLPNVDIVHDLEELPWPVPDNSCSVVLMSHVWEHIKPWLSIKVMDEMWRVLAPGGQLQLVTPYGWSHGFVMDPTHCNPANEDTWRYFDATHELYKTYQPKPWRILRVESQRAGNMFAVMEPIAKNGAKPQPFAVKKRDAEAIDIVKEFHIAQYDARRNESDLPKYGRRYIDKFPADLWRYVELIEQTTPELLIETGTANGASAQFFLDQMRRWVPHPKVVTVDTDDGTAPFSENPSRANPGSRPEDQDIEYILGSSTNKAIIEKVADRVFAGTPKRTMVVLDSDHGFKHVLTEMLAYFPLVSSGQYLVVEDSEVNGHPVFPHYGPGPWEAVEHFFSMHPDEFEVDRELTSRFMGVTSHTWLKRN